MSDFSATEQSFALPSQAGASLAEEATAAAAATDVQPHEVDFRRLRGAREIARVVPLRQQIALPAAALDDPAFALREKKETRWASSAPWCVSAST
jgi:hypothetical protein